MSLGANREQGRGTVEQLGEAKVGLTGPESGEQSTIERLILTERYDFPLISLRMRL